MKLRYILLFLVVVSCVYYKSLLVEKFIAYVIFPINYQESLSVDIEGINTVDGNDSAQLQQFYINGYLGTKRPLYRPLFKLGKKKVYQPLTTDVHIPFIAKLSIIRTSNTHFKTAVDWISNTNFLNAIAENKLPENAIILGSDDFILELQKIEQNSKRVVNQLIGKKQMNEKYQKQLVEIHKHILELQSQLDKGNKIILNEDNSKLSELKRHYKEQVGKVNQQYAEKLNKLQRNIKRQISERGRNRDILLKTGRKTVNNHIVVMSKEQIRYQVTELENQIVLLKEQLQVTKSEIDSQKRNILANLEIEFDQQIEKQQVETNIINEQLKASLEAEINGYQQHLQQLAIQIKKNQQEITLLDMYASLLDREVFELNQLVGKTTLIK